MEKSWEIPPLSSRHAEAIVAFGGSGGEVGDRLERTIAVDDLQCLPEQGVESVLLLHFVILSRDGGERERELRRA